MFSSLIAACTDPATDRPAPPTSPPPRAAHRSPLDGRSFPDKVLSLTWDDGPDVGTLALAGYLKSHRISATFFVVSSWVAGLSNDPGQGLGVFETGYEFLPVLDDLVALGHRLGNHTLNHVALSEKNGSSLVDRELRENQRRLDPYLTNEWRLFRAPGGGWGPFASELVDRDPFLSRMTGPVGWDIDRKDWDESVGCLGSREPTECERRAPGGALRTKASTVAARYLATIESRGHGIVLLHDRVGHVGSRYALDVAEALVPQLEARGYVFAAPVLRFGTLAPRHADGDDAHAWDPSSFQFGDVNGDGRDDTCGRTLNGRGITCAISMHTAYTSTQSVDALPHAIFRPIATAPGRPPPVGPFLLADVNGDGRADACIAGRDGITYSASTVPGESYTFTPWSDEGPPGLFGLADVDGDGKADACRRTDAEIACAHNTGSRLDPPRSWLTARGDLGPLRLADVDGDGRADLCGRSPNGIACGLSTGRSFGRLEDWSSDWADEDLRFGDLNGDGRRDVCGRGRDGSVVCALSNGHRFMQATVWLASSPASEIPRVWQLGDMNGDGRADLCGVGADGIVCGMAP